MIISAIYSNYSVGSMSVSHITFSQWRWAGCASHKWLLENWPWATGTSSKLGGGKIGDGDSHWSNMLWDSPNTINLYIYISIYIWVNYNDLTATSLEIMVNKGNHPQMVLIQVSEIL